ncbi:DUF4251 domain-containing protein [Mariniflexile litorale]|uniref:DUF4251 domain-containing protein n=1 Tax=Mariniflexile litorale TaxID=3045158 RepID=A0AAU7EFJ0_9FLAO|nr:DUF4251 domain-containing protein [Mariniflexile sp. KMM 9835]MDQ8212359.1 DUF4251 domain-containing protein [Mariniflexile sp. KMM 9835]
MKSIYLLLGLFIIATVSCKSSKSTISQPEIDAFTTMVANKQFRIESDWAYPQVTTAMQQVLNSRLLQGGSSAGGINLIGNSNFLRISGDSITSYLPYFGERQMNVAYGGGDSAIEFKGLIENYKAVQNSDNSYTISLEAKSHSENFNVYIKLSPNLRSDMTLNGTSRFPIQYRGSVAAINNP